MTTYRVCCFFRRKFRPATNEPPEAVKEVFEKYSEKNRGVMGLEQLRLFLAEVQAEDDAAEKIMEGQREFHRMFNRKGGISLDAFFRYLFSDDNPPLLSDKFHDKVHQDMSAPLSHYFIYTGHNSYLTGNQLSSNCSDVPIIKALQKGVRVIELDLWPNSAKDHVNVTHGRTLTTAVDLLKCLRSIKEHAFSASPYPVIITFEDHLTPDLQAKVAKMVTQTFGDTLYCPTSELLEEFPSPEDLKMRIIISTKPPKKETDSMSNRDNVQELQKKYSADEGAWGMEIPDFNTEMSFGSMNNHDRADDHQDDEYLDDGDHKLYQNVAPEYKKLIGIPAKKRKGKLSESLQIEPNTVSRLSLNEQAFQKATISHGTELVRFTQRNLLRLFPKGTRIDSSNYNPLVGWLHGAQMVALNMQGYGRPLWLMQGMFRANGGCGYVKKPEFLLNNKNGRVFSPKATLPVKITLKVKVYMGDGWRLDFRHTHFDAYSPPDFYTKVGIAGVSHDSRMKRTRAIEDDWTPVWNEEFTFPLTVPELALLRIEVHEYDMSEKDDFGGQTCLPVWEIRPGIRSVPLYDNRGDKYKNVKLLMHFQFI